METTKLFSMNNKLLVLFCLISLNSLVAQKVFKVDREYNADLRVFVVDRDYNADLLVFEVDRDYNARGNDGHWFFVDREYNADLKIFYVDREYNSGWRDENKKLVFEGILKR